MELKRELTLAVPVERAWMALRSLEGGEVTVDDEVRRRAVVKVDGASLGCPEELSASIAVTLTPFASATGISLTAAVTTDNEGTTDTEPAPAAAAGLVEGFVERLRQGMVDAKPVDADPVVAEPVVAPPDEPVVGQPDAIHDGGGAGLTVTSASAPGARAAASGETSPDKAKSPDKGKSPLELLAGDVGLARRLGPIVGLAIAVLWLVRRRWR